MLKVLYSSILKCTLNIVFQWFGVAFTITSQFDCFLEIKKFDVEKYNKTINE